MNKDYLFAGEEALQLMEFIHSLICLQKKSLLLQTIKTEGVVYSSLPLNHGGSLVNDFYIRFKKVVL